MSEKYEVLLSIKAKDDLKRIVYYKFMWKKVWSKNFILQSFWYTEIDCLIDF